MSEASCWTLLAKRELSEHHNAVLAAALTNTPPDAVQESGIYAGYSLLHLAAASGHSVHVDSLLKRRASPAATNKKEDTPLHLAAKRGHLSIATALLAGGADASVRNAAGSTPAELTSSDEVRALLENAAATPPVQSTPIDSMPRTPLEATAPALELQQQPPPIDPPGDKAPAPPAEALSPRAASPAAGSVRKKHRKPPPKSLLVNVDDDVVVRPARRAPTADAAASAPAASGGAEQPDAPVAPPVGTLLAMCSRAEAEERERFKELSVLEQQSGTERDKVPTAARERVVKRYARPSAGAPPPAASDLRPIGVLRDTVDYLLQLWVERADLPPLVRYNFISDRLRSVQLDMTVQRLVDAPLLVRIVRFHAMMELEFAPLAGVRDSGYSAHQNRSLLCNALITVLDDLLNDDADGSSEAFGVYAELLGYFVLLHADRPAEVNLELLRMPPSLTASRAVRFALAVAGAVSRSDAAAFGAALRAAPPAAGACMLHLVPMLRAALLGQLNSSWNGRELLPCDVAAGWLMVRDARDVVALAKAHGVPVEPLFDSLGSDRWGDDDEEGDDDDGALRFQSKGFKSVPKPPPPFVLPPCLQDHLSRGDAEPVAMDFGCLRL